MGTISPFFFISAALGEAISRAAEIKNNTEYDTCDACDLATLLGPNNFGMMGAQSASAVAYIYLPKLRAH